MAEPPPERFEVHAVATTTAAMPSKLRMLIE
jgi:hypothetical protein